MALKPDIPYIYDDTGTSSTGAALGSTLNYITTDGGQTEEYSDTVLNQCFSMRYSSVYSPYAYQCESVKPTGKPMITLTQLFRSHSNGAPGIMLANVTGNNYNTAYSAVEGTLWGRAVYVNSGQSYDISGWQPPFARIVTGNVDLSHYLMVPVISARNQEGNTITAQWGTYKANYLTSHPDIIGINYTIYYKPNLSDEYSGFESGLSLIGGTTTYSGVPFEYTGSGASAKILTRYTGTKYISFGSVLYYNISSSWGITYSPIYVSPATLPSFIPAGGVISTHSPEIQQLKYEVPGNYNTWYVCIDASTAEKIIHSCGLWVADRYVDIEQAHGTYTTSSKIWAPEITSGGVPTGNGWTGGDVQNPTDSPIYNAWEDQNENFPIGGDDAIGSVVIDMSIPVSLETESDNKPVDEETEELEPAAPEINGLGVFANYFAMSASSVLQLSDFLWNADETTIDDIINSLKLFGANPVNAIMSLRLYPFDVGTMAGSLDAEKIILGRVDTDVYGLKLTNSANAIIDLGKLYIASHFGDFRDYSPYSAYNLYIPFIGTVSLNPNDYLNRMISIKMIVDITTGKATAIIYANGIPMQYLDGMIAIEIPITSENMGQTANAIIGAVGSTASALVTGNIVGAAMTAAAGAADVLFNDVSINKTGNISASTSFFSPINAYVVISRPNAVIPANYGHSRGYSCDYSAPLSSIVGYTICVNVDTSGISGATDAERTQIKNLLEGGVYL